METLVRTFAPLGGFIDNRLNPLFLREIRQLVRNRFIIVLLNLFIVALVFACMMATIFSDGSQINATGMGLFQALWGIMSFACFLAVVVYTATTTSSERINGDLMFTSAMKPSAIVLGKAYAGLILTILLMTVTAPFVTLAYLLRGLDIEIVAVVFVSMFVFIQMCNAIAICVFSNIKTKVQMALVLIVGFFVGPWVFGSMLAFGGGILFFNSTGIIQWDELLWVYAVQLAITALFLAGAMTTIAPPTSNRMLPQRIVITTLYLGSFLLFIFAPFFAFLPVTLRPWIEGWMVAFIPLSLMIVSERDQWSYRIKQAVPRNWLLRALVFPFYTGAANGFVWLGLMFAGVAYMAFVTGYAHDLFAHPPFYFSLFAFAYCATALLIRVFLLSRWVSPEKTGIIVLVLVLLFTLGSMLLFALLENDVAIYDNINFFDDYRVSWFSLLNPAMLGGQSDPAATPHGIAAFYWTLGLLPILAIWFFTRVIHFSPYAHSETMTLEQAVEAVREADANPLVQGEKERQRKKELSMESGSE